MLESGRILYEKSDGKERKAYRICSYLRSKKGAEHCKAIDIEENRVVFLKLVELEGESLSVTDDPDKEDEIRNIQREGRFQFYYPFIEQVYGCKMLYTKHKDGEYRTQKPDTDNLQKLLKDCMTRCGFWKDDALVASETAEKLWAEAPGIYIRIEELEEV